MALILRYWIFSNHQKLVVESKILQMFQRLYTVLRLCFLLLLFNTRLSYFLTTDHINIIANVSFKMRCKKQKRIISELVRCYSFANGINGDIFCNFFTIPLERKSLLVPQVYTNNVTGASIKITKGPANSM